jgi:hypothetical protein
MSELQGVVLLPQLDKLAQRHDRRAAAVGLDDVDVEDVAPPGDEEELEDVGEFIDESETEAAPAAIE